ncbi:hypothetical protein LSAT2_013534 [Lamellibrachia satsuma]|nr:hypothetical protein LSAT2_013534 [Lamellibrachia satsuma]
MSTVRRGLIQSSEIIGNLLPTCFTNIVLNDEANICKTENIKNGLVAHPYICSKYIDCKGPGNTFVKEDYVYDYQNGKVYNPVNGWADMPENVDCAKQIDPTLCAADTCANGGTCEDTTSGFKCHCPFGRYNGLTCENKLTFCKLEMPCQYGGTCIDEGEDNYVCVCPKCECSTAEPFDNCAVDEANICKGQYVKPFKLIPHPYDCKKFVNCTKEGTFVEESFVWSYTDGNHVFNPTKEISDFPQNVPCATQKEFMICQHDMPCKNGGTCVNLPEDKYVCVCPRCGCSTEKPFDNCTIDEANICKTENMKEHLVAHPYSCSKYVDCSGPGVTFDKVENVYNYLNGNVYNPANGWSEKPGDVDCAQPIHPMPCAADTCANGGTCEDTMSGFKCHCPFGRYNGLNCENDIDKCASNPCHPEYNVSCEDKVDGYKCTCHSCSCSSVAPKDDCTLDSLTAVTALTACKEAKGAHAGEAVYYLPHPYKCNKYIWCYSSGENGIEQQCAGNGKFNPDSTNNNALCKDDVPKCMQT